MSKRDYDSAIVELRLAILQNPSSPDEHRYLGQTLLLVHRQPEAVRELRVAVQLDPGSPLAHHYLATALFNGADFAAAETEFRQALRLQPSAENHYYLSACLMSLGRYDAALPELRGRGPTPAGGRPLSDPQTRTSETDERFRPTLGFGLELGLNLVRRARAGVRREPKSNSSPISRSFSSPMLCTIGQ
jgi:hypothetical protein